MKVSKNGQITIPKEMRDDYGLHEGVEVSIMPAKWGLIIRKRHTGPHPIDKVVGILNDRLPPDFDVDKYIDEVRRGRYDHDNGS